MFYIIQKDHKLKDENNELIVQMKLIKRVRMKESKFTEFKKRDSRKKQKNEKRKGKIKR